MEPPDKVKHTPSRTTSKLSFLCRRPSTNGDDIKSNHSTNYEANARILAIEDDLEKATVASRRRSTWNLVLIGCNVIGFGNIVNFPKDVGMYGGGRYTLIYILCMFTFGVPLLYMELTMSAYAHLPLSMLTGSIAPALAGVSIAQSYMHIVSAVAFYVPVAWTLMYAVVGVFPSKMNPHGAGYRTCADLGNKMRSDCLLLERPGMCCMRMPQLNGKDFDCCDENQNILFNNRQYDMCDKWENSSTYWPYRLPAQIYFENVMYNLDDHELSFGGSVQWPLCLATIIVVILSYFASVFNLYKQNTFLLLLLILPFGGGLSLLITAMTNNPTASLAGVRGMFVFSSTSPSWWNIITKALEQTMFSLSLARSIVGFAVRGMPTWTKRPLGANIWAASWLIVIFDLATSLCACVGTFALMGILADHETCVENSENNVLELWNWVKHSGHGSQIYPYTIVLHSLTVSGPGWRMYSWAYHSLLVAIGIKLCSFDLNIALDACAVPWIWTSDLWRRRLAYSKRVRAYALGVLAVILFCILLPTTLENGLHVMMYLYPDSYRLLSLLQVCMCVTVGIYGVPSWHRLVNRVDEHSTCGCLSRAPPWLRRTFGPGGYFYTFILMVTIPVFGTLGIRTLVDGYNDDDGGHNVTADYANRTVTRPIPVPQWVKTWANITNILPFIIIFGVFIFALIRAIIKKEFKMLFRPTDRWCPLLNDERETRDTRKRRKLVDQLAARLAEARRAAMVKRKRHKSIKAKHFDDVGVAAIMWSDTTSLIEPTRSTVAITKTTMSKSKMSTRKEENAKK